MSNYDRRGDFMAWIDALIEIAMNHNAGYTDSLEGYLDKETIESAEKYHDYLCISDLPDLDL